MHCYMPALILGASVSIAPAFSASRHFNVARFTDVTVSSMVASPITDSPASNDKTKRPIDPGALRLIQYGQRLSSADWDL